MPDLRQRKVLQKDPNGRYQITGSSNQRGTPAQTATNRRKQTQDQSRTTRAITPNQQLRENAADETSKVQGKNP